AERRVPGPPRAPEVEELLPVPPGEAPPDLSEGPGKGVGHPVRDLGAPAGARDDAEIQPVPFEDGEGLLPRRRGCAPVLGAPGLSDTLRYIAKERGRQVQVVHDRVSSVKLAPGGDEQPWVASRFARGKSW